MHIYIYICDRTWENRSYLHKIHLFILRHVSLVLYVLFKICLVYRIPHGFWHIRMVAF